MTVMTTMNERAETMDRAVRAGAAAAGEEIAAVAARPSRSCISNSTGWQIPSGATAAGHGNCCGIGFALALLARR